jgi:hypothetical protein
MVSSVEWRRMTQNFFGRLYGYIGTILYSYQCENMNKNTLVAIAAQVIISKVQHLRD